MSNRLEIYLLGGLRVQVAGRDVPRFRSKKCASLLAYLAYHNRFPVCRELLVDQFWPEDPPENGRNSLNTAISSLRRQIGEFAMLPEPFLVSERHTVRLNPGLVWTDVDAFRRAATIAKRAGSGQEEALAEAMELYQGDLLKGFYDEWIPLEAVNLDELHQALLELPLTPSSSPPPSPVADGKGNLPLIANSFVGREAELRSLVEKVGEHPLVSIVGFGGLGKTRMAIELGKRLQAEGRQVWLISYAASPSTISLTDEIARQLGIPPSGSVDAVEQLSVRFQRTPATIILDNLEHLENIRAELPVLLDRLRGVSFVATTRVRLNLQNETVVPLDPLPIPGEELGIEELRANASAALFVGRSMSAQADFSLNPRNAEAIRELCRRLEGNSLMIELAAARVQVYSVREMVDQLDRPLDFLVTRIKDRSERHRSVRATIDWSYRLLSPKAQELLPKLALAKGGWTLPVARQVLSEPRADEIFQELIDASLLRSSFQDEGRRFGMHPTIAEFGAAFLTDDEHEAIQECRVRYFIELASSGQPGRHKSPAWLRQIDSEIENVRDCLQWAVDHSRYESAARLAAELGDYWEIEARLREGIHWIELACAAGSISKQTHALARLRVGRLYGVLSDWSSCERSVTAALEAYSELGDQLGYAHALDRLALIRIVERDGAKAEEMMEHVLEVLTQAGHEPDAEILAHYAFPVIEPLRLDAAAERVDRALAVARERNDAFSISGCLLLKSEVAMLAGDYEEAEALIREALPLFDAFADTISAALARNSLARLFYLQGKLAPAATEFERVMQIAEAAGDTRLYAHAKVHIAKVRLLQGDKHAAEPLLREAAEILRKIGDPGMGSQAAKLLAHLTYPGHLQEAVVLLKGVLETLRNEHDGNELFEALLVLAEVARSNGMRESASSLQSAARTYYARTCVDPDPVYAQLLGGLPEGSGPAIPTSEAVLLADSILDRLGR